MTQSCKTCKFAKWERNAISPLGQIGDYASGECRFVVAVPALPDSITIRFGWTGEFPRSAIFPGFGKICPTWQAIEEKP